MNWEEGVEGSLAEVTWIVESFSFVNRCDLSHFFLGEVEVEKRDVVDLSFVVHALWDDGGASLHGPAKQNLSRAL